MTRGAVRCSAWFGVAVIWELKVTPPRRNDKYRDGSVHGDGEKLHTDEPRPTTPEVEVGRQREQQQVAERNDRVERKPEDGRKLERTKRGEDCEDDEAKEMTAEGTVENMLRTRARGNEADGDEHGSERQSESELEGKRPP